MKFCDVCDNMLYIKSDAEGLTRYACKNCGNSQEMGGDVVVISDTQVTDDSIKYMRYVTPLVKHDPTMPHVSNIACRNSACTRADGQEHDVIVVKYDYNNLRFLYMCAHCSAFWVTAR